MTTKKTTKKAVVKKEPVAPKMKAVKNPKFKLISYTLKAVIPVGQYANIQPEVTVQADSIEAAERAVMPYIETLFAKYRDGGVKPIEPVVTRPVAPVAPVAPIAPKPVAPVDPTAPKPVAPVDPTAPKTPIATSPLAPIKPPVAPTAPVAQAPVAPVASPIIPLTVPFNRAKGAIESCMSHEAIKLVADQVEKSTKLIDSEKAELRKLITIKTNDITIAKGV